MLSKIIIFVTRHNLPRFHRVSVPVVNCFQKLLSSWHDTTLLNDWIISLVLWIAFKNYYLRDTTQQTTENGKLQHGCELLSKIIIFVTRHNLIRFWKAWSRVVNCFQKLLSSWHDTTPCSIMPLSDALWIAFKNYYLRDTTQRSVYLFGRNACCELLSKIIIFVTRHNLNVVTKANPLVVNCFQKLLSSWHDTTKVSSKSSLRLLWIAFKNYYLRDTTQPSRCS